ncbi:MAG: GtrA family protein [Muribaculaceae bacterium]|nr:GtrA family protein [Muribaculaceae bacterium]
MSELVMQGEESSGKMKRIGKKMLKSDSLFYVYLRSIVTSQAAGWTDMGIGFILFAWAGLTPLWATAAGAFCGGVLNCILNYSFTFHADGCDWRAVMMKYTMVWVGSMLLNSFGTEAVYHLMCSWQWLEDIGFRPDGYYAAARLFTSLMVSWFWNFALQRYFVYRKLGIDRYLASALGALGIGKHNNSKEK